RRSGQRRAGRRRRWPQEPAVRSRRWVQDAALATRSGGRPWTAARCRHACTSFPPTPDRPPGSGRSAGFTDSVRSTGQRPAHLRGAPEAHWIAPPGMPADSFGVFHARRTFDLGTRPARFVVHVSADNRYRLYVNGVQVSSGPQRSYATHWRYETIDLAPQLVAGPN